MMDRESRDIVLNLWLNLLADHERDAPQAIRGVAKDMLGILPNPEEFTAVVAREGRYAALMLSGAQLYALMDAQIEGAEDGLGVECVRVPLNPARDSVSVTQHLETRADENTRSLRRWCFQFAAHPGTLEFQTDLATLQEDPNVSAERFARNLAAELGWEQSGN
jgi:hypothetical protein